jgi:hypothetical protein
MPKTAYWFVGAAIALLGVLIARVLTPSLPSDYQLYGSVLGITLAVLGILAAALGAGKSSSPTALTDSASGREDK